MQTTRKNKMPGIKTLAVATGLALALGSLAAQADPGIHSPRVNARQQHQAHRIGQGVKSGELTRREARSLAGEQRDIRQLKRAYKSDGSLTAAERRDLRHEQNQASRDIRRQKHDAQERN